MIQRQATNRLICVNVLSLSLGWEAKLAMSKFPVRIGLLKRLCLIPNGQ